MKRLLWLVASIALLAAAPGCGSKPIPMVAVAGTTVTIALPAGFGVGYGLRLARNPNPSQGNPAIVSPTYDPNSPLEDPQRGDLVFDLYTNASPPVFVRHLMLDYITRVGASLQSPVSQTSAAIADLGQTLAFVKVPHQVAAGDYLIQVRRYRRSTTAPYAYVLDPDPVQQTSANEEYLGWGDDSGFPGYPSSTVGIPITIKAGDGANHYTPFFGWADVGPGEFGEGNVTWTHLEDELLSLAPAPHFDIQVPATLSQPQPAAWEISFEYPRKKIRIIGVELRRDGPSGALVRWSADEATTVTCSDPDSEGTLRIQVIDPDLLTNGVRVAYQLRNFDQACGGRAVAGDFDDPTVFEAYDQDGKEITNSGFVIPADAFL